MKHLSFSYESSSVSSQQLKKISDQLAPEIERVNAAWNTGYQTDYASLSLPFDTKMHEAIAAIIAKKKSLNPSMLIVVGIGGSQLGALAVQEALLGSVFNYQASMPIFFADSVDSRCIGWLYAQAEQKLKAGKTIIIAIISKSGTTTETIANAQLFTALLARYVKDYFRYIVIISDHDSVLWDVAQRNSIDVLEVPKLVGGRFSVLSSVGLFPLGMIGINTKELAEGARSVQNIVHQFDDNPAAISAAILYALYQKGYVIHDSFFFVARLAGIGMWYRQLLAESIGKLYNHAGKQVQVGITPTVSIGSDDLHSMVQLYLAGPNNRVTTFITVIDSPNIKIPTHTPFDHIVPMIQGKTYEAIMHAILHGTKMAYYQAQRPFMSIELPEISAYYIGQFMQLKMIEIMYLGALFAINPFDQPQVELYKTATRKLLAHD